MSNTDKLLDEIDDTLERVENKVVKLDTPQVDELECLPCKYNVGIGLSISICKEAEIEGIDCEELKERYKKEELTPLEVMDTLINNMTSNNSNGKDFKRQIEELTELKSLMGFTDIIPQEKVEEKVN